MLALHSAWVAKIVLGLSTAFRTDLMVTYTKLGAGTMKYMNVGINIMNDHGLVGGTSAGD